MTDRPLPASAATRLSPLPCSDTARGASERADLHLLARVDVVSPPTLLAISLFVRKGSFR